MTSDILDEEIENNEEIEKLDRALRPEKFADYIGQNSLINKLEISIAASKERNEPLDHCLLIGGPGLGKTTIAGIIANESECNVRNVAAPSIKTTADLLEILTKLKHRDILFIDECHGLNWKSEEYLYSAMEDYKVDVKLGNKEIISLNIAPFCLIGATTMPGKMSQPLRERFGIIYSMEFYNDEELSVIVRANAYKLDLNIADENSIPNIASRSRGVPRIANRLLRRVRDFAQIKFENKVTNECVNEALKLEGIDNSGLNPSDRKYLNALYYVYGSGPAGVQSIAATIGEDHKTVELYIEPFLVRKQLVARSKAGRILTAKGMEYVQSINL